MSENNTSNEKVGRVNSGCLLLKEIIHRFEYSYNLLSSDDEESFYNKPFSYLEDFLYFKQNFELIINTEIFDYFQMNYCKKLITLIKIYIYNDNYNYELNMDIEGCYYITVFINVENEHYVLSHLYPFTRNIYIPEYEYKQKVLNKINDCELAIKELTEYEKVLMMSKKNPVMMSESPVEMLKMTFNKEKYRKKFNNSLKENDINIHEYYKEIAEYKSELEEIQKVEAYIDFNRENFLLDINKSPFEFYIDKNTEDETEEFLLTENGNQIEDIVFFE